MGEEKKSEVAEKVWPTDCQVKNKQVTAPANVEGV
jgi:hypothetical protein